jgi:transcriptional regulator with XRE-family HTH domain
MKDILVRNLESIGHAFRARRSELGWSQLRVAELMGVDRKWVMRLERGNPGAELGLVLKAMSALQIQATLHENGPTPFGRKSQPSAKLDEVFARLGQRSKAK